MDFGAEDRPSPKADNWPVGRGRPADGRTDAMGDGRPTERLAIWSLLCSIFGFAAFTFGLAAVAGIVLGFKARARIIRAEGATKGAGLALAGIITGFGALLFLVALTLVELVPHGAVGTHSDHAACSAFERSAVASNPQVRSTELQIFLQDASSAINPTLRRDAEAVTQYASPKRLTATDKNEIDKAINSVFAICRNQR